MARLEALWLKGWGMLCLLFALTALPDLLSPQRQLTPVARALPEDSLPRREAVAAVHREALARLVLGGVAGAALLGLGGLRAEVAGLRERLEELAAEEPR